jgi:hypothetical protein
MKGFTFYLTRLNKNTYNYTQKETKDEKIMKKYLEDLKSKNNVKRFKYLSDLEDFIKKNDLQEKYLKNELYVYEFSIGLSIEDYFKKESKENLKKIKDYFKDFQGFFLMIKD